MTFGGGVLPSLRRCIQIEDFIANLSHLLLECQVRIRESIVLCVFRIFLSQERIMFSQFEVRKNSLLIVTRLITLEC